MSRACVGLLLALVAAGPAWADPSVPVPSGYRTDEYHAPVPDTVPGAVVLDLAAVQAAAAGGAVLVDVLPAPRRPAAMRAGAPWLPPRHSSLPGALWWPDVGRGGIPDAVEARFRERLHEVTAGHPGRLVVFFCQVDCWMSWNAARRAGAMGFRAGWYPDGVDGWHTAGLPMQDVAPEFIE